VTGEAVLTFAIAGALTACAVEGVRVLLRLRRTVELLVIQVDELERWLDTVVGAELERHES
jgi:hypothetical protein